jgi:ATP-dependent Clp protease ATP-binding subunit ClpA
MELNDYLVDINTTEAVIWNARKLKTVALSSIEELIAISIQLALANSFRLKFINRLDKSIFFDSFFTEDMISIVVVRFQQF